MKSEIIDNYEIADALLPLSKDKRDLQLGQVVELPALESLPADFEIPPVFVTNQSVTDFCTGWATCGASAVQEGVPLIPEYSFALIKEIQGGDVDAFGADLRSACKAHVKVGAIEEKDRPAGFSFPNKRPEFLRRIENWPAELKQKAAAHRKGSFLAITGPYDHFDNIRASLWYFRKEKRTAVVGCDWSYPSKPPYVIKHPGGGGGHAVYYNGQKTIDGNPYLILVNSQGEDRGDKGRWYVSREFVNHFVEKYGAFMFLDESPDYYRAMTQEERSFFLRILAKLAEALLSIQKQLKNPSASKPPIQIIPPDEELPPPAVPPTPEDPLRRLIEAMIQVESGGNDYAKGDLGLKHPAYGPMQIRQPACDDVNKKYHTNYRAVDCNGNRVLSIEIFRKYIAMWATPLRLGREVTHQDRARIWNGGPTGWKRSSTLGYWNKVKKFLH